MTNIAFVVTNAMTATTNIRQNILSLHMRHHITINVPPIQSIPFSSIQTRNLHNNEKQPHSPIYRPVVLSGHYAVDNYVTAS